MAKDSKPPPDRARRVRSLGGALIAGVAGLSLLTVFLGGAHVASDSSAFCASCHGEHGRQWTTSTHKSIECVDCHVAPGIMGAVDAKVRGVKDVYVSLTRGNEVTRGDEPLPISTKNCLGCHAGILRFNEMGFEDLPQNSLKASGLIIGHRIHVEKHGIDCVSCHRGIVHRDPEIVGKYPFNMPMHSDCAVCHNGEPSEKFNTTLPHQEDKERCTLCHPTYQPPPS